MAVGNIRVLGAFSLSFALVVAACGDDGGESLHGRSGQGLVEIKSAVWAPSDTGSRELR